jgi:hypothetical protein
MGLDSDRPGIGRRIAEAALACDIDLLNAVYLTPLPGTRLWNDMHAAGRIAANCFPQDWQYYSLACPVAEYRHLSWSQLRQEMEQCWRQFYAPQRIAARIWRAAREHRAPLAMLVGSLSYRRNYRTESRAAADLDRARRPASRADSAAARPAERSGVAVHVA